MRFKLIPVCFMLILASGSCQKDDKTISEQVIGKWEWLKTVMPFSGQETNPGMDRFSLVLEISGNRKINKYENGRLTGTSSYSIQEDEHGSLFSSAIITSHFYFEKDTLIFSEAYVDGPASYYKRVK